MNLRFAFRQLRLNAGFTAVAVTILGLGIGANTALFSVIHSVLLRPLPYPDADRILALSTAWANQPESLGQVSGPDFADWRDRSSAFDSIAAYAAGEAGMVAAGTAWYAEAASVSSGFARVMGVPPAQGRWFTPEEEREGGPPVAVISHHFAQQAFAGEAIGKTLKIRGRIHTVVGVMPSSFRFPDRTDVWAPSGTAMERESRSAHNWRVVARLKPDVNLLQARGQLDAIASQLAAENPEDNRDKRIGLMPLRERLVRDVRQTLLMLFGAVALVLLIACVNVANLLLARGSTRTRELAVRAALGATRGRIVRQLLTESLVLSVMGGLAGIAIGRVLLDVVAALAPPGLTRTADMQMHPVVLAFAAGLSLVSTLAFGLIPALKTLRIDINASLKESAGRTATAPKLPSALVAGEVGLATTLAIAAALVIQTFGSLLSARLGYDTRNVLIAQLGNMDSLGENASRIVRWHHDTAEQMRQIPGVLSVAGVVGFPGAAFRSSGGYAVDGRDSDPDKAALFTVVTPRYFSTMRIPLLSGRDFSEQDRPDAPFVAIVNRALARQAFPDGNAIGRQIQCGLDSDEWMTIVGIVEDARTLGPATPAQPELYLPAMQHPKPGQRMSFVLRTAGDPASLSETVRRLVRERGPEVPVKLAALETLMSDNIARPRFRALVLGAMAALAVLLAMTGMYGVMAYRSGLRSTEFGVRMALGAEPQDIVRMVLAQGSLVTLAGLAIGIAGALAAARLLESMIWGVTPRDPATYAGVAVLVMCVALAANLGPALRSGRVNPVKALR